MTEYETDILAELIGRKLHCLTRLQDMGQKQLALVRDGDMTQLLDILAAKQRVLWELQRIERAMDPFRGQDPDQRRWRTPEKRKETAHVLQRCETLLDDIVTREKQSEHELLRRRDEAAARLEGTHSASRARGAYIPTGPTVNSQLDLSSEA
jgi:hypothetical protein